MTTIADMSGTILITSIICFTIVLIALIDRHDKNDKNKK